MIYKLSLKNVRKSFNDYTIYFLTLTFAVALSYIFNLIPYQPFMAQLSSDVISNISLILFRMTIPIALIVAGLELYSNNFLIKKRSREIGIYLMLGTKYTHIHMLLLMETFIVSAISFFAGIGVGMGLSRVFDLIIMRLMSLKISNTSIFFSAPAMFKTLVTFIIIFILISLFNYFLISRAKILDMVQSNGETLIKRHFKNKSLVAIILFLLSIGGLVYFYYSISDINIDLTDFKTGVGITIGILSHFLFCISGASILSLIISKNKRHLYSGCNLFTLKQITDKISRNGLMLGVVSLIMTLTITLMNMGFLSRIWVEDNLKYTAPYSFSISGLQSDYPAEEISSFITNKGYCIKDEHKFKLYRSNFLLEQFIDKSKINKIKKEDQFSLSTSSVRVIKQSDYNRCKELLGQDKIKLPDDEVGIILSEDIKPAFLMKENIRVCGNSLKFNSKNLLTDSINDARGLCGYGVTLVVGDEVLMSSQNTMNFTYSLAINTNEKSLNEDPQELWGEMVEFISQKNGGHLVVLQNEMRDYNLSQASNVIFCGLFIGLLLLVVCASILSLQQMSEITERKKGYEVISKLGVADKKVFSSILKQIVAYFLIPIIISSFHSIFATVAYSRYSHLTVHTNILINSIIVTLVVVAIAFTTYILFTYMRCKKLVRNKNWICNNTILLL